MLGKNLKIYITNNQGFTLIELLVAIVIIGILSAIALPSYLNQASKAKSSEAKSGIGTINRYQQVYRVQHGNFSASLNDLDVRVSGKFYTYAVSAITSSSAIVSSTPQQPDLTAVSGGLSQTNDTFLQIICESDIAGTSGVPATVPTQTDVQNSTCPTGYSIRQ